MLAAFYHDNSVIHHLSKKLYEDSLASGTFVNGILPKLENAFSAIDAGVKEVLIGDATDLIQNIGQSTNGTLIVK